MKKILCALSVYLMMAGAAQAKVINITNWDGNNASVEGLTYPFEWNVKAADSGNDVLYTFTRTGDLDDIGASDDTLTFDLRLKAWTGSSFDGTDVTLGTVYDLSGDWDSSVAANTPQQHFGPGGDIDNNQSYQLSMENISFVQGENLGWDAAFDGFSAISKYGTDNTTYYFGTTEAESVFMTGDGDTVFSGPLDILTVTATANGNRFRDLDFGFTTAIPEPATLGLVVAFGGGILFVRRRFMI